jgi:uncharacterized membrane protein
MNELLFAIAFALIILVFVKRRKIADYFSYQLNIRIETEVIVYILTVFVLMLVFAGMLLDNTKEKYSDISENYDKMKGQPDKKPHRYFDVNTYD